LEIDKLKSRGRNKLNGFGENGRSPKEFAQKKEDILLENSNAQQSSELRITH